MKPAQLITAQIDLVTKMENPSFVRWMWESAMGSMDTWDPDGSGWYDLLEVTRRAAKDADCYRISDDMSTLVQASALSLDASDTWDTTLAPTVSGLARFDRGIPMTTIQGWTNVVHWVLWRTVPEGTLLFMFNDTNFPDEIAKIMHQSSDPAVRNTLAMTSPWGAVYGTVVMQGTALQEHALMAEPERVMKSLLKGEALTASTNAVRYVHALWLQIEQKFTDVEPQHVRKNSAAQAVRTGISGRVNVVQLRRSATQEHKKGESTIERTRRWLTRGHWRWQPYGLKSELRKRIWIDDHVKGPEDMPLVISTKVYDVKR